MAVRQRGRIAVECVQSGFGTAPGRELRPQLIIGSDQHRAFLADELVVAGAHLRVLRAATQRRHHQGRIEIANICSLDDTVRPAGRRHRTAHRHCRRRGQNHSLDALHLESSRSFKHPRRRCGRALDESLPNKVNAGFQTIIVMFKKLPFSGENSGFCRYLWRASRGRCRRWRRRPPSAARAPTSKRRRGIEPQRGTSRAASARLRAVRCPSRHSREPTR